MKSVLIVCLLSLSAYAQQADAPLADIPGVSVSLDAGQPAPFTGRLLSHDTQIASGKVDEYTAKKLAVIDNPKNMVIDRGAFIAIVTGSVVISAVITGLVIGFSKK